MYTQNVNYAYNANAFPVASINVHVTCTLDHIYRCYGKSISSYQVKVQPPVDFSKHHLTLPWKSKWLIGKL